MSFETLVVKSVPFSVSGAYMTLQFSPTKRLMVMECHPVDLC